MHICMLSYLHCLHVVYLLTLGPVELYLLTLGPVELVECNLDLNKTTGSFHALDIVQ